MSNLKVNTINDASGGSAAVLYGVASPPNSMGNRNRIINGGMVIDQRNNGASVTPGSGSSQYAVDRFLCYASQNTKYTAQRNAGSVTPPVGFSNYLGITSSSAYSVAAGDIFFVIQNIEGFNTSDLMFGSASASTVTISFWVRSSLTGTFGAVLQNSAQNRSYPFSYTISAANTWEQKSVTIAGDTTGTWIGATNGIGMRLLFALGTGSTYSGTAGAWAGSEVYGVTGQQQVVGTNGATFYITGVQLEAGTVASPFERRDYGRELMMCQRYFISMSGGGSNPAIAVGLQINNTTTTVVVPLPTTMRSVPTIGADGGLATTDGYSYNTGATLTAAVANNNSVQLTMSTSSVGAQGRPALLVLNTSSASKLNLTAEL